MVLIRNLPHKTFQKQCAVMYRKILFQKIKQSGKLHRINNQKRAHLMKRQHGNIEAIDLNDQVIF